MSVNFTFDFLPPSNSSFSPHELQCSDSTVGRHVLTAVSLTYALLVLPLSIFILYVGFQRWRRQRSVSSAAIMTHSDFFTYNMAVVELVGIFGFTLYHCSSYANLTVMLTVGGLLEKFTWPGLTLFPTFMCVERYVAVVHPITYRGLRKLVGVRIRNISTGCIWLTSFAWLGFVVLLNIYGYYIHVPAALILTLSFIIIVFCSLSVLRALIRPRPGKVSGDGVQVNQLKQKAIHTTLIVMVVLWLKFFGNVIIVIASFSALVILKCVGEVLIVVFFLPCGILLPLLFLHRARKLPNWKHTRGLR